MTLKEAMARLEELGTEQMRAMNAKNGAGDNQFGVKMGDLRTVAKVMKSDPDLAKQLWVTRNADARLLSILITKPRQLAADELDAMIREANYPQLHEWLTNYVIKAHPEKDALREKWMKDKDPNALRAGWSLTAEAVEKNPDGLDLDALLNRIEKEMKGAHEMPQWTMNWTLLTIGINHPPHRKRAIEIGEKLGVYRDYPCSKGCISPFAPIAIVEMSKRK